MSLKTNSTLEIKNTIDNISNEYKDMYLQRFQYIVKEYMIRQDSRGILLFHSPGSGKSITAAAISETYRRIDPSRKIVILLAKSLQNNFKGNIRKYMFNDKDTFSKNKDTSNASTINNIIETKYKFVSLNASNMYAQISNIGKTNEEKEFEKSMGSFNDHIAKKGFLENSLLIIDEVHNFANGVKNGSKNSINLYNTIMSTKNVKLLFLTGTPIVNSPFDIVPLFNMLKGYMYEPNDKTRYTLFPENLIEFYNFFVDRSGETVKIKNKNIFQNRITSLVSYYGTYYFQDKLQDGFPTELPIIIEKVHMSAQQFNQYREMRSIEEREDANSFSTQSMTDGFGIKGDNKSSSSYRIRSRQASNYSVPIYAINKIYVEGREKTEKLIHTINKDDLKNVSRFSPKYEKMIENINSRPNQLSVVYSEFVQTGITLFSLVLEASEGYIYWRDASGEGDDINDIDEYDLNIKLKSTGKTAKSTGKTAKSTGKTAKSTNTKRPRTYALIHGDVPFTERAAIIKAFNSKNNVTGDIISLILISKSGAEGLTLKNVRSIHIMEPFWNYARIEQIIARGARFNSHILLDKKDQTIQPYLYISTYPIKLDKSIKLEPRSTDEELLHSSLVGKKLRSQFELAMIESSVDCSINYMNLDKSIQDTINCHLCSPNNLPLYTTNIHTDIKTNNCKPIESTEIDVKKIIFDGTTYYYTKDKGQIHIYEFDKKLGSYIEMKKNNILYNPLFTKLQT
jgi:superfamily II DNA or RNA helicase